MSLTSQIDTDLTAAMRARDQEKLDALRMVRAALKNEQIALGHELSDEAVVKVLRRLLKQRQEAAQQYRTNDRGEAAAKEEREADLISGYLPVQLSDEELKQIIQSAIATSGATSAADFGQVIGPVIKQVAGRADGRRAAELVRQQLVK